MNGKHNPITTPALVLLMLALGLNGLAWAQEPAPRAGEAAVGSAFTYQGQLQGASGSVTGACDFQFSLWDALTGGAQVGTTQTKTSVVVNDGMFTVDLDFGTSAFAGSASWLEISVRCPAGNGNYTTLAPRQALTPTPYALYSTNTDLLDGLHASSFQQHYQNRIVVAKSGGDFTSIQAALDSITTASDANRYLVWVAPGVYTETVTMKPYVDIEGAGELLTMISYTGSSSFNTGTVVGASDAELRFLTVRNTGGNTYATAIYNDHASPRLTNVTAFASGGSNYNCGIWNTSSSPTMTNVTASASGGASNCGVYNDSSSPTMTNVTASASGGTSNYGVENSSSSSPAMTNVTASASGGSVQNYGVHNLSSSPTMTNVTASASGGLSAYGVQNFFSSAPAMTNVTASASGGSVHNYGVHNNASAPTMTNVTASASGGTESAGVYNENCSPGLMGVSVTATAGTSNYGIRNYHASPTMTNVTVAASGGTDNYGVYNDSASPTVIGASITATGETHNYGMWNDASSPKIQNSVIRASGGTNDGLHNIATTGSYVITINASQITAGTSTIYQDSHYTTKVGASQLAGGGAFGGTYVCAASYNGNYTLLNGSCQP